MSDASPLAVVTGASRGIGRATAIALAARGLRLALVGRSSSDAEQTRAFCLEAGAPAATLQPAELSDLEATHRAGLSLLNEVGTPAVVVHNAGLVKRAPIEQLLIEEWQHQLTVNLSAPFVLTRALLPAMRAERSGRILFVSSISATLGSANQSAYCASKWGLVGLMKTLAEELSDSGLMTAAILPGSVDTEMLKDSGFEARMRAEDVARTLTYFATDAPLAHNGAVVEMFGT